MAKKINIKQYITTQKKFPSVIDTPGMDAIKLYTKPLLIKPYCKDNIDKPDFDDHVLLPTDAATSDDLKDYIESFNVTEEEDLDSEEKGLKPQKKAFQSTSGIADGVHFDSKWEYAYYLYIKNIEGRSIERNTSDYLFYIDAAGKRRRFYYDFTVDGCPVEVKGIFRANDTLKMEQCPQVTFIYGATMQAIIKTIKKEFPEWEKDFIVD